MTRPPQARGARLLRVKMTSLIILLVSFDFFFRVLVFRAAADRRAFERLVQMLPLPPSKPFGIPLQRRVRCVGLRLHALPAPCHSRYSFGRPCVAVERLALHCRLHCSTVCDAPPLFVNSALSSSRCCSHSNLMRQHVMCLTNQAWLSPCFVVVAFSWRQSWLRPSFSKTRLFRIKGGTE